MEQPVLTEPGVRFFISQTLKECKKKKDKYINTAFNLISFLGFILFFGFLLYTKYPKVFEKGCFHPGNVRSKT